MKFDRTDGNKARYVVHKYGWNVEDHYYFSDYDRARVLFNEMKTASRRGS